MYNEQVANASHREQFVTLVLMPINRRMKSLMIGYRKNSLGPKEQELDVLSSSNMDGHTERVLVDDRCCEEAMHCTVWTGAHTWGGQGMLTGGPCHELAQMAGVAPLSCDTACFTRLDTGRKSLSATKFTGKSH